jgi:hypothetical protein
MHHRSGLGRGGRETSQMNQWSKGTLEETRRKGVRRTVMVFGAIAVGLFLLSLLQGLQYS